MHTTVITGPNQALQGLPLSYVLLAYSPVIVAALILIIGTIWEMFKDPN